MNMQMVPLIQKSLDILIEKFGECADLGKSFKTSRYNQTTMHLIHITTCHCVPACRLYRSFTLETLLATAFGRRVEVQRGEADELTNAAKYIFSKNEEGTTTLLQVVLSKTKHLSVYMYSFAQALVAIIPVS